MGKAIQSLQMLAAPSLWPLGSKIFSIKRLSLSVQPIVHPSQSASGNRDP